MEILDANIFIEARKRYYAFDICPGYWKALLAHHGLGALCSLDRIRDELTGAGDDLSDWVLNTAPAALFHASADPAVVAKYGEIIAWVQGQAQFLAAAKTDFAAGADGWLIAYAAVHGYRVVTEEIHAPDVKKKVPIPNVCIAFGVQYIDTFALLRHLHVQLEWTAPALAAGAGLAVAGAAQAAAVVAPAQPGA